MHFTVCMLYGVPRSALKCLRSSMHSKRTRLVTRLVTRVGSCNGLQGSYKLVMMAFKACNPMELVMMTRLVMIFK